MITQIFTEKMSDYKVVDVVLKLWVGGLLTMFVLGMGTILFEIITNPSVIDNATFGIFDTLGD